MRHFRVSAGLTARRRLGPVRITGSNLVALFSVRTGGDVVLSDNTNVITYDSRIGGDLTCSRNISVSGGDPPNIAGLTAPGGRRFALSEPRPGG
jgi:hypothetical protein